LSKEELGVLSQRSREHGEMVYIKRKGLLEREKEKDKL
jgi:hypothetical protein